MRWPWVRREWYRDIRATLSSVSSCNLRLLEQLEASNARYEKLLDEILRRGLKDEKEPAPAEPDDKPLPAVIASALGQWPEGSAPYVQNRNYAFGQLLIRPEEADAIAREIREGEDVELFA